MNLEDKNPSKLYFNFKIHKPHAFITTPPPRPIISRSGSITENIVIFVEKHINELLTHHTSYLQDIPHFLRIIEEEENEGAKLPLNSMIVTSDLTGAYQNIQQEDGIKCLNEALEDRVNKEVPSDFLTKLME